ncbi:MAG TPA: HAMP domain-containing sensor histidine kinase [Elusimicrobiota bacterium]|nr:HAMP domain-containing sensor histidine kinase [Elusimicrobiota bacterium]
MTIRVRLIAQTVFLQVLSLLLLAYGVFAVQRTLGQRDVERAETQIRLAVARTATDALIQKDQVQLLSYLNFLKVQYPALAYARTIWRNGDKVESQSLGAPGGGDRVLERRVVVSDPASAARSVEVLFGVDQDALRQAVRESQHRMVKILALVGAFTALVGLMLAIVLSRSLARSLAALGRMAEQISEGRLGVRLEWSSDDEIGALVRVFNNMSARLADLDLSKKNFVSSVTHELRSPLGAIESFLPLIREKVATREPEALAQGMEYMDRIEANVHRLNRFITDLLDVAKIEQGKMECVIRRMDLGPIASEVAQFFEAKADSMGVAVESRINGEPPVLGDADRVRQILVNLVANGLKFTPSGGRVWIEASQLKEGGERWLDVAVSDTGRGMDEADQARLFKPFSQGRNVSDGVAGPKGTGLGLYIVKSIVDQHGGKIDVRSVPGQGTRISFSLKVAG